VCSNKGQIVNRSLQPINGWSLQIIGLILFKGQGQEELGWLIEED